MSHHFSVEDLSPPIEKCEGRRVRMAYWVRVVTFL
jgi:hypothetical protein